MAKLIFATNLSLDGCVDHTKQLSNEEVHRYFGHLIKNAGLLVYGRKTFELMVPFWPDVAMNPVGHNSDTIDFAQSFDSKRKLVFSRSLESIADLNSELCKTDLFSEIALRKIEENQDILTGGVDVPGQLIAAGLVDEYYFVIHPIIAGQGRRLDALKLSDIIKLNLVSSTEFDSGHLALHYSS